MSVAVLKRLRQIDASLDDKFTKAHARMDRIEAALNRTGFGATDAGDHKAAKAWAAAIKVQYDREVDAAQYPEYRRVLATYLRKDKDVLTQAEVKALSVGSDPDGGYWVTPEISGRVIQTVFDTSPVRQFATVETINASALTLPVDRDEAAAVWVGEAETRSETATPQIEQKEIVAHEMSAEPRATQKILDDANINVEQWLAGKVADKFARLEATAFVSGSGVKQPRGFLTYPAGTGWGQIEQVPSGSASAVTHDGLVDLVAALKAPYRQGAVWMLNRNTAAAIQKLKDSQQRPLWQESIVAGQPSRLLGFPVVLAEDLPDVAGGALAIAFGNLAAGYIIVDRAGIRVLRDPFTAKPFVKFYTTRRVGGDVVNFEAIKLQVIST